MSRGIQTADDETSLVEMQAIVDELAQSIRRPITLEDAAGRLLAYSVHEQPVDNVRVETLLRRGASSVTLDALRERGVYKTVESSDGLARIPAIPELGFSSRVCLAIRGKSRVMGYLWVVDPDSTLSKSAEEAILRARRQIAVELARKGAATETKDVQRSQLIAELCGRERVSEDALISRGKAIGWYPSSPFTVVVVRDSSVADRPEAVSSAIEGAFAQHCPACLRGVYAGDIVGVLAGPERKSLDVLATALTQAISKQDPASAVGIGGNCDTLAGVRQSYADALKAISLGKRLMGDARRFDYGTLAPYELLSCLTTCKKAPSRGRDAVEKVIAYDGIHGGSLFTTLEVFLDYCGQRKKAASRLCVHPNTLDYRIQKVRELTGIDLEDPSERLITHVWVKALSPNLNTSKGGMRQD